MHITDLFHHFNVLPGLNVISGSPIFNWGDLLIMLFFLVFAFYFLLKSWREEKINFAVIGGIFYGLGFYADLLFYLSFFLWLALIIRYSFIYKKPNKPCAFCHLSGIFLFTAIIVLIPLIIHFL